MTDKTSYVVPKVHEGIAAILNDLSVEKNGTLPQNLGGKPYISAADLSLEIKRKFVEHKLILLPRERETRKELINGQRLTITLSIEGEYTIISTEDGSFVTISGVGDGVANGSAVAANIASTNALKNALLRTFLVTEQSVEDYAKNGPGEAQPQSGAAARALGAATKPTPPPAGVDPAVEALKKEIRDTYISPGTVTTTQLNVLVAKVEEESGHAKGSVPNLTEVKKRLAAGEVG